MPAWVLGPFMRSLRIIVGDDRFKVMPPGAGPALVPGELSGTSRRTAGRSSKPSICMSHYTGLFRWWHSFDLWSRRSRRSRSSSPLGSPFRLCILLVNFCFSQEAALQCGCVLMSSGLKQNLLSTSFHLPSGNLSDETNHSEFQNINFIFKCLILHGTSPRKIVGCGFLYGSWFYQDDEQDYPLANIDMEACHHLWIIPLDNDGYTLVN